jgi:hypothetical protein
LDPFEISSAKVPTKFRKQLREIGYKFRNQVYENCLIQSIGVYLDRLYKENMLHYLRASLKRIGSSHPKTIESKSISSKYGPIFFLQGADANQNIPREKFDEAVRVVRTYDDLLKSQGIRFIFLPIPEKESIYYEYLKTKKPVFLQQFISRLKNLGIETVDTQRAFDDAFRKGIPLYHPDDTHWNENAVKIAADLIKDLIEMKK